MTTSPLVADRDRVAWFLGQGQLLQLDVAGRWLAIDAGDHVFGAQPRRGGRAARRHCLDEQPFGHPGLGGGRSKIRGLRHALTRLTAGFEYVGPPLDYRLAKLVLNN